MTNKEFDAVKWGRNMQITMTRNKKEYVADVVFVGFRDRCILVDVGDKNEQGLPRLPKIKPRAIKTVCGGAK